MSIVINKTTLQIIELANTPDYPTKDWIINPTIPKCDKKFWKVDVDTLREMTQEEKDELEYSTNSTLYYIIEKKLEVNKNGHDYEKDTNIIINPTMPACDIKYTRIIDGVVVEMKPEEKTELDYITNSSIYIIDTKELLTGKNGYNYENNANILINPILPAVDLIYTKIIDGAVVEMDSAEKYAVDLPRLNKERNLKVTEEVRKIYSLEDELYLLRKLITNEIKQDNQEYLDFLKVYTAAKEKYPIPSSNYTATKVK